MTERQRLIVLMAVIYLQRNLIDALDSFTEGDEHYCGQVQVGGKDGRVMLGPCEEELDILRQMFS